MQPNFKNATELAELVGVNKSTTTRAMKGVLKEAVKGDKVDMNHPKVIEYLKKRNRDQTPPIAEGLDPLYEQAVEILKRDRKVSIRVFKREFKIGTDRGRAIVESLKGNGLIYSTGQISEKFNKTLPPPEEKPEPPPPEEKPEPPKEAYVRGTAAKNEAEKMEAAQRAVDAEPVAVPDHLERFADMTLREICYKYGTDRMFKDYLSALKTLEEIEAKRIKNATDRGELISRVLVRDHLIDPIDATHRKLMTDGAKNITTTVVAMVAAGKDPLEIEEAITRTVGSFLKPVKNKLTRVLKNA